MSTTQKFLSLICFLLLTVPLWGQQSVIVIEGGTLIDGTGSPPRVGTTILIEGNRIREIGDRLSVPAGAQVISAAGKYVIPGLIDTHTHSQGPWMHRLFLANGVTTVRDMGGAVERVLTLRQEIRAGNILAPRMFISGMGINPRSIQALNFTSHREMAEKMVEAGVDGIKITGYTPQQLKEVVEVAHANGLLVYGHPGPKIDGRAPGVRLAVEAGIDGIEHSNGILEDAMGEDIPVPTDFDATRRDHLFRFWYGRMHHNFDTEKADSLIQLMVEEDVYYSPTLVNSSRHGRLPEDLEADPALRYIPEGELDTLSRFGEEEHQEWNQSITLMKEMVRRFHEAGGLLIAGTDAPGAAHPGWSIHQEMELFVEAGIPPLAALQTATLNNARVLNKENELGTVKEGHYADLVILDANPLEEISNTRKIHLVIKDGLVLDPAELLAENLKLFGP